MSNTPPAWVVNAALPPVLNWENCVVPPKLVTTVALPAVLEFVNSVVSPVVGDEGGVARGTRVGE